MDFSDETITTPRIKTPISIKKSTVSINQEEAQKPDDDDVYKQCEEEDDNFPAKMLTRNHSVASGTSSRFKQKSTGATLAMRRSSSVSERYCRIHDQYVNPFDNLCEEEQEEEEAELQMARSENKMKKQSKGAGGVVKACKRIFGF